MSCVFVLKGSSGLGGRTLVHHVTPSLPLLLPALLKGRGVGLLTYLYSRPLSRKRNKALSQFAVLRSKRRGWRSPHVGTSTNLKGLQIALSDRKMGNVR